MSSPQHTKKSKSNFLVFSERRKISRFPKAMNRIFHSNELGHELQAETPKPDRNEISRSFCRHSAECELETRSNFIVTSIRVKTRMLPLTCVSWKPGLWDIVEISSSS